MSQSFIAEPAGSEPLCNAWRPAVSNKSLKTKAAKRWTSNWQ